MLLLDLHQQYQRLKEKIDRRLQKVIDEGEFILGPEVYELERQLALFAGVEECITVANGTDALMMTLMALDIQCGDEVITTAFTFAATAEAICLLGAIPVFIDINAHTYNLDPHHIQAAVTDKTRAIVVVSLFGQCADFDTINHYAYQNNIVVIEDAAQSFGAMYKGRFSCNLSHVACTSFFPSKPLACYGDGGACFTNDQALACKLRQIRAHGQTDRYQHSVLGMNSRLDTLQAGVLLEKLTIFSEEIETRNDIARAYKKLLGTDVKTPFIDPHNRSVFGQYTVETPQRDRLKAHLQQRGVPTAIHYPKPLYRQTAFQHRCRTVGRMQHTETAVNRVLSLPMHAYLETTDVEHIAGAMKEFYSEAYTST